MATIVYCHAHPDDEASQTSGAMARASAEGHRVVVVFATNGDHGEVAADAVEGETVADYRRREAEASAAAIGLSRIAWLGYADSGMAGWDQNDHEDSLHRADLDEAAARLAAILDEERADVLVGYDWHGGYGHPDHVKVHHVVRRAADLAAARPRLLESTMNRTEMVQLMDLGRQSGMDVGDFDPEQPMDDGNPFGSAEDEITWRVDVTGYLDRKRAAMEAHGSQATDIESFLSMPSEVFDAFFGYEHLIEPGDDGPMREGWPFA
jgi:LmbE family N-acetylglucosaminyl deacetylase